MPRCPSCGGEIVRIPSSRLDQLIGRLTDLRPHACTQCAWTGRRRPAPEARRGPYRSVMLPGGIPVPHRRRAERLSCCPVCGQRTIGRAPMGLVDRLIARLTKRVPLVCHYCLWTGRRRPHRSIEGLRPQASGIRAVPGLGPKL